MVSRTYTAGWIMHITVAGLLLANGLALPFIVNADDTFEGDTGHARADVQRDYPGVVDDLDGRGTTIGVVLAGFAALMLATAISGFRGAPQTNTLWVAVGVIAAIGTYFVAVGRLDIAAQYLLFAAVGVAAQVMIRRQPANRGATAPA